MTISCIDVLLGNEIMQGKASYCIVHTVGGSYLLSFALSFVNINVVTLVINCGYYKLVKC